MICKAPCQLSLIPQVCISLVFNPVCHHITWWCHLSFDLMIAPQLMYNRGCEMMLLILHPKTIVLHNFVLFKRKKGVKCNISRHYSSSWVEWTLYVHNCLVLSCQMEEKHPCPTSRSVNSGGCVWCILHVCAMRQVNQPLFQRGSFNNATPLDASPSYCHPSAY